MTGEPMTAHSREDDDDSITITYVVLMVVLNAALWVIGFYVVTWIWGEL